MKDHIKTIASVLAIIATVFAAWCYIDAKKADCEDVKRLERRLEYKIENDVLMGMQQRQWQLQAQFPKPEQAPQGVQQRMRELNSDIDMQRNKVKKLEGR